jgi:hypothetical protein
VVPILTAKTEDVRKCIRYCVVYTLVPTHLLMPRYSFPEFQHPSSYDSCDREEMPIVMPRLPPRNEHLRILVITEITINECVE